MFAGFIMTGVFAHGAIFFIRDYNPEQNEDNVYFVNEKAYSSKIKIKNKTQCIILFLFLNRAYGGGPWAMAMDVLVNFYFNFLS
jgi:hypothetical protein